MKAAVRTRYGSPNILTIQEVDQTRPKSYEILVRVHATTVNRTDCGILSGYPVAIRLFTGLTKPKLTTTGTDFAGEVQAVGKKVSRFKIGDKVWGFNDNGLPSHAKYLAIAEDQPIAIIPAEVTYKQAAASAEGAHYAYNFINKVDLRAGSRVMLNGATGAIGSAALQFLKHAGAYVTATANTKNVDLIKSLEADRVINYEREDFTQDDERYDFVFDAVGKSTFGRCKRLLKPQGIYISSELGPKAQNPLLALITPLLGGKQVKFPVPLNILRSLNFTNELLEAGKFRSIIDRTYSLGQIQEAFRYVASGQKTGNVVISLDQN
ncbi:NAD(P)-dependent alcohol dehydrogenase [Tunicatimonas pelagia]|uniref:NAD(P)-dependent alcohol dehydrogenase n=1 Tax=Tunicatimonas pelagia TaxID=931531 RepID=UPI002665BCF7|nr:NAD(P)-dependent alcohol dehydrogenase [Tunicatimonas pelagia]WKN41424.1 NAD(P)-dependent alcohol dehydrogenase [Tunicatimonas pelagia]